MSVAQYNRGTAALHREADQQFGNMRNNPSRLALEQSITNLTGDLSEAKQTINAQADEIQQLQSGIETLKRSHKGEIERLNGYLNESQRTAERWHSHYLTAIKQLFALENAHKRAGAILRMFTPEQVDRAREDAKEVHPQL